MKAITITISSASAAAKVWECEDDLLETLETILEKQLHFHTVDHQLKVYGYCEECQKKRDAEAEAEAAAKEAE